jgi:hypothetical protein
MRYNLYKQPIQYETLYIVQYLHSLNIDARPNKIYECNYPANIISIPSILDLDTQILYTGLLECIKYYEIQTKLSDLLNKAIDFNRNNPNYRINN